MTELWEEGYLDALEEAYAKLTSEDGRTESYEATVKWIQETLANGYQG